MTINFGLKLCPKPSTSKKEITYNFRVLAKQYHPDIPTGSVELFRELKRAYDFLMEHHNPIVLVDGDAHKYYRTLSGKSSSIKVKIPESRELEHDVIIYFMVDTTSREFRLPIKKGTILPKTYEFKIPLHVDIAGIKNKLSDVITITVDY